jgi:hypothetical protein
MLVFGEGMLWADWIGGIGSCAGTGGIHVASLRREISMNCLMSLISEGMVAVGNEEGLVGFWCKIERVRWG